eukprot:Sdes_comp21125_c0_seq1m19800
MMAATESLSKFSSEVNSDRNDMSLFGSIETDDVFDTYCFEESSANSVSIPFSLKELVSSQQTRESPTSGRVSVARNSIGSLLLSTSDLFSGDSSEILFGNKFLNTILSEVPEAITKDDMYDQISLSDWTLKQFETDSAEFFKTLPSASRSCNSETQRIDSDILPCEKSQSLVDDSFKSCIDSCSTVTTSCSSTHTQSPAQSSSPAGSDMD